MDSPNGQFASNTFRERKVLRCQHGLRTSVQDSVAEEVPVALLYNGQPHVVMLASPQDLEDFAVGFSLSEGIVGSVSEITEISAAQFPEGIELTVGIPFERQAALAGRERNLAGRTGCGLCGSKTLAQAVKVPVKVGSGIAIEERAIFRALAEMMPLQSINQVTGAVHAAAWALPDGDVKLLREDVGRHNALDKLIGALARQNMAAALGFVTVTSRASYEMVQKAAMVGATTMVAVSAPTDLAIRLAEQSGFTLIGFARSDTCVIYANPQRVLPRQDAA